MLAGEEAQAAAGGAQPLPHDENKPEEEEGSRAAAGPQPGAFTPGRPDNMGG